jgi:pyruvate dehydrogenase E1 component alpha subunit
MVRDAVAIGSYLHDNRPVRNAHRRHHLAGRTVSSTGVVMQKRAAASPRKTSSSPRKAQEGVAKLLSSPALLERAYRSMRTIRSFEERLHTEIAKGEIPGFTHLYAGQEACAAGVCEALRPSDYIVSTHRGHGHCIAKGCDVVAMMKEIYGKDGGLCGGKGGSMHIADLSKGMLGANGIVGGGPPLAVGAALAARNRRTGQVAVAFGGDGSCNQGTVFEAMNLAVVLKVPALFVFENNGYSEHTGVQYAVGSGDLTARAKSFGMPAIKVDGNDFFAVYTATSEAVAAARKGHGPASLELLTCRYYGHVEGDPQRYRAKGEVKLLREKNDCLKRFRDRVTLEGALPSERLSAIDDEIESLISSAVALSKAAPRPAAETAFTDVYNSY